MALAARGLLLLAAGRVLIVSRASCRDTSDFPPVSQITNIIGQVILGFEANNSLNLDFSESRPHVPCAEAVRVTTRGTANAGRARTGRSAIWNVCTMY